jgi:hypothetical protein
MNARHFICIFLLGFASCHSKYALKDRVILKTGNTQTGTITQSDSNKIILEKYDLSKQTIPWSDIDSVSGISNNSFFISMNASVGKVPYYAAFNDDVYSQVVGGYQIMAGRLKNSKTCHYAFMQFHPAFPNNATKIGFGKSYYFFNSYTSKTSAFVGGELAIMNIPGNNFPQIPIQPFVGGDYKINGNWYLSGRFGLQRNIGSRNTDWGPWLSLGVRWMRIDYDKRFALYNRTRRLNR